MTSTLLERSSICLRAVDFRAVDDETGDGRTLEGYAAVFDKPTLIRSWGGDFEEEIAPGAFRKTLRARTPVLQFDHGRDMRTGSVPIGSIERLAEDDQGLDVLARLFDNPVVEPIRQAIAGKAITGMSFRFEVAREQWFDRDGVRIKDEELAKLLWEPGDRGPLRRRILEVDPLYELGPVVFPAYDQTSVTVRSLLAQLSPAEHIALLRQFAADLRGIGDLSRLTAAPTAPPADEPAAPTQDLTGRPALGAGGGDSGAEPQERATSTSPEDLHLEARVLRALGVL